jgi:hypothetical protein
MIVRSPSGYESNRHAAGPLSAETSFIIAMQHSGVDNKHESINAAYTLPKV